MMTACLSVKRLLSLAMLCLTGAMLTANPAIAQTIESLLQDKKLSIMAKIVPQENIVAMQQLELQIEVATDKWFGGGIRIERFEIKDAIVLQREKFAVNFTRVEAGIIWTVQTWTLTVYPQRAGVFDVPAIALELSIAGEGQEKIEGELSTEPFGFSAMVPDQLLDKDSWVASPTFSVKEQFDPQLELFKPGDALIRTVKFSAEDTPAMMLPTLNSVNIDGIGIYHKPPELSDKVNRGDYFAERTESLTYVFEEPGKYVLPEEIFYWWNVDNQQLEEIILPAHPLEVGVIAAQTDSSGLVNLEGERAVGERPDKRIITALVLGLLVIILFVFKLVRKQRGGYEPKHAPSERGLQKAFKRACRRGEKEKAVALLYQYLDYFGGEQFSGEIRPLLRNDSQMHGRKTFDEVMLAVFSEKSLLESDIQTFANQFVTQLKKSEEAGIKWPAPIELKLN